MEWCNLPTFTSRSISLEKASIASTNKKGAMGFPCVNPFDARTGWECRLLTVISKVARSMASITKHHFSQKLSWSITP